MSSVVTIGFLDRTHACVQTAYALPLADDERREILAHIAFLTARTFAALPAERQLSFAGVLRDWVSQGFSSCPVTLVPDAPGGGLPRFASTFQAPSREYALATNGCGSGENGIEYFLPMGTAAFLLHVAMTDHDPAELFKPVLALCGAVAISPITVATHFQLAAACLPKVGSPVVPRFLDEPPGIASTHYAIAQAEAALSAQRLHETRKTLIASAVLALLLVVAGVQYLSTRGPEAGPTPSPPAKPVSPPAPVAPVPSPASDSQNTASLQQTLSPIPADSVPATPPPAGEPVPPAPQPQSPPRPEAIAEVPRPAEPAPQSSTARTLAKRGDNYRRALREISENSLAQTEVMLAAARGKGMKNAGLTEALDYGMRQIQRRQKSFETLSPPPVYAESHHETRQILADLAGLAKELHDQSPMTPLALRLASARLAQIHARLDGVLDTVEGF